MTPKELVMAFLGAMEARDLPRARSFLEPGTAMTFPGGRVFTELEALVAWSKGRYRSVRKTHDRVDEMDEGDTAIVYCHGRLNGEGLDGKPIKDVRFIDRFEVRDGKIVDQKVWNDLAELKGST